jgi:hypothetical protein
MPWCHWFAIVGIDIRMVQYGTLTLGKQVGARLGDPLCGIKYIMQNDEISDMTFSIMPLSITTFSITIRSIRTKSHYAECYAECCDAGCPYAGGRYTECRGADKMSRHHI